MWTRACVAEGAGGEYLSHLSGLTCLVRQCRSDFLSFFPVLYPKGESPYSTKTLHRLSRGVAPSDLTAYSWFALFSPALRERGGCGLAASYPFPS